MLNHKLDKQQCLNSWKDLIDNTINKQLMNKKKENSLSNILKKILCNKEVI